MTKIEELKSLLNEEDIDSEKAIKVLKGAYGRYYEPVDVADAKRAILDRWKHEMKFGDEDPVVRNLIHALTKKEFGLEGDPAKVFSMLAMRFGERDRIR